MHSGEKLNKCNQCDYATLHAYNLREHLKTHSGEKPNQCNVCDYASSRASNLRRHLKFTVDKNAMSISRRFEETSAKTQWLPWPNLLTTHIGSKLLQQM